MTAKDAARWSDALLAASLFAIDPVGIGGVVVRSSPDPLRDRWLSALGGMLPGSTPQRRLPLNIADNRLLGGLDLAATLRAGRPVAERGLLVEADGGVVVVAMAERLSQKTAACLAATADTGEVIVERDGIAERHAARFGIIALDEGIDDEHPPPAMLDRLAIHITLRGMRSAAESGPPAAPADVATARSRVSGVQVDDEVLGALCEASLALGISSLRAPLLALRVARASAALAGRETLSAEDVGAAARLVLAPRATQLPSQEEPDEADAGGDAGQASACDNSACDNERMQTEKELQQPESLDDIVLAAAQAAMPPDVLAHLKLSQSAGKNRTLCGHAGTFRLSSRRGRPIGSRRGELRSGARLSVIDTLRAAVPWQAIRRRERAATAFEGRAARIDVRREDFHVLRFKQRTETTTIFVVDASGSTALNRLAEAKGAVEYLLGDCYVRRDSVALISFRGSSAELLLPPTRSLVRAKRGLAGLPGGGGTPLAAGIDAARALADDLQRRGQTATAVFLTDGRANIARDGYAGRGRAEDDALSAARLMNANGVNALLIDTSPRASAFAQRLADEMAAVYVALPHAEAAAVSKIVQANAVARRPGAQGG
jgi:magnesium chelatase subunit D